MARPRRAAATPPRWSETLRALREASGVTQDGWAAHLGYSRATIQRWERGESAPDAAAERAILAACHERGLFRVYQHGPLAGLSVTDDLLREILAEGRAGVAPPGGATLPSNGALRHGAASPPRPDPARTNLPAPSTSFVGREDDRITVLRLLERSRLVTLTGTGGVGKTRLALETSAGLVDRYAGGVWLVELAALADPTLIAQATAEALGVREAPNAPILDGLVEALRGQPRLILLDNCEHLIADAAAFAETLLRRCPDVRILATSRAALGVVSEIVWWVPSLEVPSSEFRVPSWSGTHSEPGTRNSELTAAALRAAAVRLFCDRAATAHPAFALTDANAAAVAAICRRLDGLPLAIELAAARARILTAAQIAAHLDERFRLLTGGSTELPSRQQTLRAALDWSHDLLTAPEQTLLARLSVFAGGCELEAVEAVCVDDLPPGPLPEGRGSLDGLFSQPGVDSTLGDQRNPDGGSPSLKGGGRGVGLAPLFDLLASLAQQSLITVEYHGESARYRFLETVREYAAERLDLAGEMAAIKDRHRAWALDLAEQAGQALNGREQTVWLERLAAEIDNLRIALQAAIDAGEIGDALAAAGSLYRFWLARGLLTEGRRWLDRLLEHGAEASPTRRAQALRVTSQLAMFQGDKDRAQVTAEAALSLYQDLGNEASAGACIATLGQIAYYRSDFAAARGYAEECLAIARRIDHRHLLVMALCDLANTVQFQGELEAAAACYREAVAVSRDLGDLHNLSILLGNLAVLTMRMDDYAGARPLIEEALAVQHRIGGRLAGSRQLSWLAMIAQEEGDAAAARAHLEQGLHIAHEAGDTDAIAGCEEALADLERRSGDLAAASRHLAEALRLAATLDDGKRSVTALLVAAKLAADVQSYRRAARLIGAAQSLQQTIEFTPFPRAERDTDAYVATVRGAIGDGDFAELWFAGAAMSRDEAIAHALAAAPARA